MKLRYRLHWKVSLHQWLAIKRIYRRRREFLPIRPIWRNYGKRT